MQFNAFLVTGIIFLMIGSMMTMQITDTTPPEIGDGPEISLIPFLMFPMPESNHSSLDHIWILARDKETNIGKVNFWIWQTGEPSTSFNLSFWGYTIFKNTLNPFEGPAHEWHWNQALPDDPWMGSPYHWEIWGTNLTDPLLPGGGGGPLFQKSIIDKPGTYYFWFMAFNTEGYYKEPDLSTNRFFIGSAPPEPPEIDDPEPEYDPPPPDTDSGDYGPMPGSDQFKTTERGLTPQIITAFMVIGTVTIFYGLYKENKKGKV